MTTPPTAPAGNWLMGSMNEFASDALGFILRLRAHGDIVRVRFGPFYMYFVNHPDAAREVLVTDARHYDKPFITKQVLSDSAGKGLFTNDGEPWKRQRKLVSPAFHTQRIAAYADVMVDYAQRMTSHWSEGKPLDIEHEMTALTMSIVSKTLFNVDIADETSELGETITTVLSVINKRFNRLIALPRWLPVKENREMRAGLAKLNGIIDSFIGEWRRTGEDRGDLLSMLLMAQDDDDGSGMSDQQVHDEAVTLFVAGHETTAMTLIWVWYLLSQHPDIEARLHAELAAVLGGRAPTFADLDKLVYTEMVVKEALRLYPPAWAISRGANQDTTLGGYPVKQGMSVMINVYGMHRDARFFADPERFDPERFRPENEKHIAKYAYIPFGAGPRVCIGNSFAMMEATLIVATLAQRFTLSHAPGHVAEPERVFTLRPKYGMDMIAHVRQPVTEPAG